MSYLKPTKSSAIRNEVKKEEVKKIARKAKLKNTVDK